MQIKKKVNRICFHLNEGRLNGQKAKKEIKVR